MLYDLEWARRIQNKGNKSESRQGDSITLENLCTVLSTEQRLHPLYTQ